MKLLSKEIFDFENLFIFTATNLLKSEDQTEIFLVSIYLSGSIGGKSDPHLYCPHLQLYHHLHGPLLNVNPSPPQSENLLD